MINTSKLKQRCAMLEDRIATTEAGLEAAAEYIASLEAEVARLRAAPPWKPVADAFYRHANGRQTLHISGDGEYIGLSEWDGISRIRRVTITLPAHWRVCQTQNGD